MLLSSSSSIINQSCEWRDSSSSATGYTRGASFLKEVSFFFSTLKFAKSDISMHPLFYKILPNYLSVIFRVFCYFPANSNARNFLRSITVLPLSYRMGMSLLVSYFIMSSTRTIFPNILKYSFLF